MDHRSKLVTLALLAFSGTTFAGFAQVAPPLSFTNATGVLQYQASANDISFGNGVGVRGASGVINVGGRSVTMPAAYRFAANAPRIAARFAFANPLAIAGSLAYLAYEHYKTEGFEVDQGIWIKKTTGEMCSSGCYEYWSAAVSTRFKTAQQAANAAAADHASRQTPRTIDSVTVTPATGRATGYTYTYTLTAPCCGGVPAGTKGSYSNGLQSAVIPPWDTTTVRPATPEEFESLNANRPLSPGVPQALPIPLPVEIPILNPTPGDNPQPQPMRVPQGLPQPVPNSDPQQWKTPVVDLVPSPSSPWVVDAQPKEITTTSSSPLPDTSPVPVPTPEAPGDPEAPVTPDLCEKYPDILACAKFTKDQIDPTPVNDENRNLAINKDAGWGPDNASCPPPRTTQVMGVSLSMPFTMICDVASQIRPLLIGFAWLSAALTFFGLGRKD